MAFEKEDTDCMPCTSIFDEMIDRTGTLAIKSDYAERLHVPSDAIPMWVADMDFRAPACVNDAIAERARHGIYGYSDVSAQYRESVRNWYATRHAWNFDVCNIVTVPGVVFGIYTSIRALTRPGDAVLISRPVYYPFSRAIQDLDRVLVNSPLVLQNGRYAIDFDDLEAKIATKHVKVYILCSPHNPVGRVWSREELERIADICIRHHVYLLSDEIHADFVFDGHRHLPIASLSPEIADLTITCTAPSKTFNLAGLQVSNLIISNPTIAEKVRDAIKRTGYSQPNVIGLIACQAAYEKGAPWLDALLSYIQANIDYTAERVALDLPGVRLIRPEGTYLLWLDMSGLGLSPDEVKQKLETDCKVWFDHGSMFGPEGENFQRMNIACPRSLLERAMNQMKEGLYR